MSWPGATILPTMRPKETDPISRPVPTAITTAITPTKASPPIFMPRPSRSSKRDPSGPTGPSGPPSGLDHLRTVRPILESLDEFTGTYFVGVPDVTTLPLLLFTASMEGNYQIASITALILLVPSVGFMLFIERFLKADVLAKVGT